MFEIFLNEVSILFTNYVAIMLLIIIAILLFYILKKRNYSEVLMQDFLNIRMKFNRETAELFDDLKKDEIKKFDRMIESFNYHIDEKISKHEEFSHQIIESQDQIIKKQFALYQAMKKCDEKIEERNKKIKERDAVISRKEMQIKKLKNEI